MTYHEFTLNTKAGRPFLCDVRYVATQTPKPVILFIHGFKGFKDWGHFNQIADFFAREGFVYMKINLSHNGTTPDNPTEFTDLEAFARNTFTQELEDVQTALEWLHASSPLMPSNEIDTHAMYLLGHSRGGALALLKTAEEPRIQKVATLAAIHDFEQRWPTSFVDQWKEQGVQYVVNGRTGQQMPMYYRLVEDFYAHKNRLDIPTAARHIRVPLLITHGTADESLDVSMAYALAACQPAAELFIVEGANHVFGGGHPWEQAVLPEHTVQVLQRILTFFRK